MKFGIFYEHQLPRPWTERSEYQLLQDSLAPDRAGRPARLRLRVGASSTTSSRSTRTARRPRSSSARRASARSASGSATASSSSRPITRSAWPSAWPRSTCSPGGRVELGLGEGQGPVELHPFGRRVRDKREVWKKPVRALDPGVHASRAWEWHGQYFDFPARNVVPKPFQKPHPPLWVACSNIATIAERRPLGHGRARLSVRLAEAARAWVNRYYLELTAQSEQARRLSDEPEHRDGAAASCAPRPTQRRWRRPRAGRSSSSVLSHYGRHGIPNPGEGNMWEAYQEWRHTDKAQETLRSGAHRLAGDHPPASARVRGHRRRPGDPPQPGRRARPTRTSARASSCSRARSMPEFHAREPEHAALEGRRPGRTHRDLER